MKILESTYYGRLAYELINYMDVAKTSGNIERFAIILRSFEKASAMEEKEGKHKYLRELGGECIES
jgi:hypothetical protein